MHAHTIQCKFVMPTQLTGPPMHYLGVYKLLTSSSRTSIPQKGIPTHALLKTSNLPSGVAKPGLGIALESD